MESYGIQWISAIKFHQTQWNLMVPMRFLQSNLIQPNGILWDPWDFSNQTSSNPMESYGTHEILATKSHQTQWNLIGPIDFSNQISSNPKESSGPMRTHHCWSLKIWKIYSPNGRFLIKFFLKIISLDSSQRVPPMSIMPIINNNQGAPWLINSRCP